METDLKIVEKLFAEALVVAPGSEREDLLAKACAGNAELRCEVEALLAAHEERGRFLGSAPTVKVETAMAEGPGAAGATSVVGAATHAAVFLAEQGRGLTLEKFLTRVPEALRREVRERIEAARPRGTAPLRKTSSEAEALPQIPGFTLRRVLGRGGLGTVYEAWDEKLKRAVALKVLLPRAGAPQRARILDEARHAAAVRDTGIVTIYSVLDESDPPAIVMELVNGFPLDQFCQNLTWEQKSRILQEVARALAVAHKEGLIHRDLKPENILIGPDMKPKVLDFGLAVPQEQVSDGLGYFEGSPLYASPEQAAGKALTAASDVFSFGSVMFKVLAGQAPFPGETVGEVLHALATTRPPFLRDVAVGMPEDLQAICLACLSWQPEDRPTAAEIVVELGRYLAGEPVHLKPQMYDDILRQRISAHTAEAESWERQRMISRDEQDSLQVVHRRILADEDHWIIDARRLTYAQTALYAGAWLVVVAAGLIVGWLDKKEIGALWWLGPAAGTLTLLGLGWQSDRRREELAAASFLAAAALSVLPAALAGLEEMGLLATKADGVKQLFPHGDPFTNQQLLVACLIAWAISMLGLARLKMTGFAWTTAVLGTMSYLAVLLQFDWWHQDPEIMALWCLPLAALELVALAFERMGRVRWTTPFHLISLAAMVVALDVMAGNGPTLKMMGVQAEGFFDADRLHFLSFALNGVLFLILMLTTERARSLDLRRAAKMLEILGISHILGPLFFNAMEHKSKAYVTVDVALYLCVALTFLVVAPWRSRWRLMIGGLAGMAFGSCLLLDFGLVAPREKEFIFALGLVGLAMAVGTYLYLRRAARPRKR